MEALKSKESLHSATARKKVVFVAVKAIMRWLFLIAISYILLYPLLYMISAAVKDSTNFSDPTVVWIPKIYSFSSFRIAWKALDYGKTFINTLKLEIVSAFLEIFACSLGAYGLARFNFRLKKPITAVLLITILVPTQMIIIPLMLNFRYLDFFGILAFIGKLTGTELRPNLLNTPLTFYLPSLFAVGLKAGFFTFIYMQFFKGLPKELEEAAWIDGAGPFTTFFRVIIPSSGVVILTVSIFSVIWHWNDYYLSVMYLSKNYPIAVMLNNIFHTLDVMGYSPHTASTTGIAMAGCLMTIAPMLIMYIILQRKFIQSIDRVGIVG